MCVDYIERMALLDAQKKQLEELEAQNRMKEEEPTT